MYINSSGLIKAMCCGGPERILEAALHTLAENCWRNFCILTLGTWRYKAMRVLVCLA